MQVCKLDAQSRVALHSDRMDLPSPASTPRQRSPWEIQRAVYYALYMRELKTRFGGRWMGAFWLLLEPIAHLSILLLIFGYVRHRVMANVEISVFLLTGVISFFMFRTITLRVMDGVDGNRGLFGYRQVKPIDTLLVRAALELTLYGTVYVVLTSGMLWLDLDALPVHPLQVMALLALLVVMGFSLGMLFAILTDDLPELRAFVRIAFLPIYLLSGAIFPIATVPTSAQFWFTWNPVLHVIELLRGHYFALYHVVPAVDLAYPLGFTLVALATSLALYRVRRDRLIAT